LLQDLVGFLSELHAFSGIDLFLHQQGLDATTCGAKGGDMRRSARIRRAGASTW
jgi:hypothetical protein